MKRTINIFLTVLLSTLLMLCCLASCKQTQGEAKAIVEQTTETMVVIKVNEAEDGATLLSVMEALRSEEKLSFELASGMISSINGKANPADYSSCWMLYTSDTEMANTEWGTTEYHGNTLGSAILGADALTVIADAYYIWVYQTF